MKTEVCEEYEMRQVQRQEHADSYRKTYLSLQKDSLRKDMPRKVNVQSSTSTNWSQSMKFHEVVGRKIFS